MSFWLSSRPGPTTVSRMQDRDVVAAVVAGDPDGIAEAYDRYAASLYALCHSVLTRPEAAAAVRDTFLIAVSRLDGLGDPDRLAAWLHAVARNECLRRLGPKTPRGSLRRPRRCLAQRIRMSCRRSRFRPNSAGRC